METPTYTISKEEFKELFGLEGDYTISEDTLFTFTNQIRGAYLLYLEACDVGKVKFKNADGTLLSAYFTGRNLNSHPSRRSFQEFVCSLGSRYKFHVSFMHNGSSMPFWAQNASWGYKDYDELVAMKNSAYRIFQTEVLGQLKGKYFVYGFTFDYRDMATHHQFDDHAKCHPNQSIWWDGLKFNSLYLKAPDGKYEELRNYEIGPAITNKKDIWFRELKEPIKRIIAEIEGKEKHARPI